MQGCRRTRGVKGTESRGGSCGGGQRSRNQGQLGFHNDRGGSTHTVPSKDANKPTQRCNEKRIVLLDEGVRRSGRTRAE